MNMADSISTLDRARSSLFAQAAARAQDEKPKEVENFEEDACPAFGYLRGLHDKAVMVEFRLHDGNRVFCPYSWLGPFIYNPSVGILLKFAGDTTTVVLLRGSNLDSPVRQNAVNLTDRGLQRHRITFVREMEEAELRRAGEGEPTVDRIDIAEFETHVELRAWLERHAPAFVRRLQKSAPVP
jgi:hypothetical protein